MIITPLSLLRRVYCVACKQVGESSTVCEHCGSSNLIPLAGRRMPGIKCDQFYRPRQRPIKRKNLHRLKSYLLSLI